MKGRAGVALPIAVALLAVSGCGSGGSDGSGSSGGAGAGPGESTPPGPPTTATPWRPQSPRQPVDARSVEREYTDALEAAVSASGEELTWDAAQVSTERFSDVCVVKLERVGHGAFSPDVDALRASLAAAVADQGFPDLAVENDPGGALTFVAHDSHDALLEFRSKGETTVAVRVATTDSECGADR